MPTFFEVSALFGVVAMALYYCVMRRVNKIPAGPQDFNSLLATSRRTTLQDNKGKEVDVTSLEGKIVGLYFSAHWCGPCRAFTPKLKQLYQQLKETNKPFEVVFVSSDSSDMEFKRYFGEMPWLAVPYSDQETIKALSNRFSVYGIPSLVLLDETGSTITTSGKFIVNSAASYPFKN